MSFDGKYTMLFIFNYDFIVTFVSSIANVVKSEAKLQPVSSHHNGSSIICKNIAKNVHQQRNIIVFDKYTCIHIYSSYSKYYIDISSSPQNVIFLSLNSSSLILWWSAPLENGQCIVNYIVKVNST